MNYEATTCFESTFPRFVSYLDGKADSEILLPFIVIINHFDFLDAFASIKAKTTNFGVEEVLFKF